MEQRNIGIALSGGGIRAMVFHLGLFKWLAEHNLFEQVKRVSSVSGASLCVGMIYAHNNLKWPTSEEFLGTVLPLVEKALHRDLQLAAIIKLIISPAYWNKRVNVIARVLESKWGVHGKLSDLAGDTMWYVNCTTYETGKRFRFCKENMGDYIIGYVENPDISLSEVMAASAGFPVLIGPYCLKTGSYHWTPSYYSGEKWHPPACKTLHLWDGGVYDNFGFESVFKPDDSGSLREGLDFIIVSNASASIKLYDNRKGDFFVKRLKRILDISMDQVAALRSRSVMEFIKRTNQGVYMKIGNSSEMITTASMCHEEFKAQLIERCLSADQAKKSMNYPTTLKKPKDTDYQLLLRHGYEVADCTFQCYQTSI